MTEQETLAVVEGFYEKPLIPHPTEFANCEVGNEFGRKLFNLINGFPLETNKWTKKETPKKEKQKNAK